MLKAVEISIGESRALGLHPVTVREIDGARVKIGPIEAFDGTRVVDIKSASTRADARRFAMHSVRGLI